MSAAGPATHRFGSDTVPVIVDDAAPASVDDSKRSGSHAGLTPGSDDAVFASILLTDDVEGGRPSSQKLPGLGAYAGGSASAPSPTSPTPGTAAADAASRKLRRREAQRQKQLLHRARMDLRMPAGFVARTLQHRVDESKLTNELMIYVPFLVLFTFLFLVGAKTEEAYWTRGQIGGQLTGGQVPSLEAWSWGERHPLQPEAYHVSSTLEQVASPQDWHMWFQSMVLDYFWDKNVAGENAPFFGTGWMQGGSLRFGALRVRSLRMRNDSCAVNRELIPNVEQLAAESATGVNQTLRRSLACYGVFDEDAVNRSAMGPPANPSLMPFVDCTAESRQLLFGFVANYPCVGNAIEFPAAMSNRQVLQRADLLRGRTGFNLGTVSDLDAAAGFAEDDVLFHPFATRAVIVEFITYLPFIDRFQSYKVLTEQTPGGRFIHYVVYSTYEVWSLTSAAAWFSTLYFFLFYIFVMYYVWRFADDFATHVRRRRVFEFVADVWHVVDFVNLLAFLAVAVCRIAWMRASAPLAQDNTGILSATSYDDRLDWVALLYNLQQWLNAVNTVISFLKVLKYMQLNPTLNIVTRSLGAAQQSLFGVLFIFGIVIVSYAIAAVSIYSNGLQDFRDFSTAVSSLMRLLLGDFDYIALRDENRFATPIFFWTFIILGLFLILNFLIGVILEAFEGESETTRAEPLTTLIARLFGRVRTFVVAFVKNPREYVRRRRERHAHEFALRSRMEVVIEQLKLYRLAFAVADYNVSELQAMGDDEIEALLPVDRINRHDLPRIFAAADPEEGLARAEWVSDEYLDEVWEVCVRSYYVHRLADEETESRELRRALESAAEDALAFVLGVGPGRGSDVQRREAPGAFAPTTVGDTTATGKLPQQHRLREGPRTYTQADASERERRRHMEAIQGLFRPSPHCQEDAAHIAEDGAAACEAVVDTLQAMLRVPPAVAGAPTTKPPALSIDQAMAAAEKAIGGLRKNQPSATNSTTRMQSQPTTTTTTTERQRGGGVQL